MKNGTGVTASHQTICRESAKQDFSNVRIKKELSFKPKHREERPKFALKHIVDLVSFKQEVFMDEKRFFLHGPDNIIEVIASLHLFDLSVKWMVVVS